MANMHLVTGYAGKTHVTAADHGAFWAAVVGPDSYILDIGQKFAATIVSNNLIRIADGDLLMQGRHVRINTGETVDLTIENGTAGTKRHDLIVARYTKSEETGVEEVNLIVLRGEPSETTAYDPEYITGDILNGALQRDLPLYRIRIVDAEITAVELLMQTATSTQNQQKQIENLQNETERLERISGGKKVGDIYNTARDMSDDNTYILADGTTYNANEYPELGEIIPSEWTTVNISFATNPNHIIYAGGKWIASTDTQLYYSLDGMTWTKATLPIQCGFEVGDCLAYANGVYLAMLSTYDGSTTKCKCYLYSTNGITWETAGSITSAVHKSNLPFYATFQGICASNGLFVCRCGATYMESNVYYSADGLNWTMTNQTTKNWYVVSGNGKSLVFEESMNRSLNTVGYYDGLSCLLYNGTAFASQPQTMGDLFDVVNVTQYNADCLAFCFDDKINKFVCVFSDETEKSTSVYGVALSEDAEHWSIVYTTNEPFYAVYPADNGYFASVTTSGGEKIVLFSRDFSKSTVIIDTPAASAKFATDGKVFVTTWEKVGYYPYQTMTVPNISHAGTNTYIKAVSDK